MKNRLLLGIVAGFALLCSAVEAGTVRVRGYYRQDGTYVQPYYRTAPDGDFQNNWSTYPNVNPYTGQYGTRRTPPAEPLTPTYSWPTRTYRSTVPSYDNSYFGSQRSSPQTYQPLYPRTPSYAPYQPSFRTPSYRRNYFDENQ